MRHLLDLAQTGEVDQQVIEETIESMDLTNDIERKNRRLCNRYG